MPDCHNGLPPSVLSLTLGGETPRRRRWRDPLRLNEMTPLDAHVHTLRVSHRHTIIRYKAPNWPAWLCVNANWVRGSSCCYRALLSKVKKGGRAAEEEGREFVL